MDMLFILHPQHTAFDFAGPAEVIHMAAQAGAPFRLRVAGPQAECVNSLGVINRVDPLPPTLADDTLVFLLGTEDEPRDYATPAALAIIGLAAGAVRPGPPPASPVSARGGLAGGARRPARRAPVHDAPRADRDAARLGAARAGAGEPDVRRGRAAIHLGRHRRWSSTWRWPSSNALPAGCWRRRWRERMGDLPAAYRRRSATVALAGPSQPSAPGGAQGAGPDRPRPGGGYFGERDRGAGACQPAPPEPLVPQRGGHRPARLPPWPARRAGAGS